MATDEPPYLTIGTDVSAKYKGAFCEAKIKKAIRVVKCKVIFKNNLGTFMVTDDQIKGPLRVGADVEAKHPEKSQFLEAVINKLQDYSQYTVVFDDGDETTLRRTSLCLKSGRHFAESPTLDQFPLTNPEHFGTPVIGSGKFKRKRRSTMNSSHDYESSEDESIPRKLKAIRDKEQNPDLGKVVCVDFGDRRKKDNWYPGLIVPHPSESTIKITKEEHLIRSFKDGKYYQVPKRDTRDFVKENIPKVENNALKSAIDKAINYLEKEELPPHWDKALFSCLDSLSADEDSRDSDSDTSDDEPSEEKDRFVAQLYKFMDERGTPINKAPTVSNKDLNLYKLFKIMHKLGGYNKVTNKNKWKVVYLKMGLPASNPNGPTQIKFAYKRFLQSFEDFYRKLGCTMVSNSRSTRGRHRSDRNIIVTRTRDRETTASPKGRNTKDTKEKASSEKKSDEKPKVIERKEVKPDESSKSEDRLRTPEKKRVEKLRSEEKKPPQEDKTKKEEKPRLVRSTSLTKDKKESKPPEKARTREDARKEKIESPEKKGTRSSSKTELIKKEKEDVKKDKPIKEKDKKEDKSIEEKVKVKKDDKVVRDRKLPKEKKAEEKQVKEKRETPLREKKDEKAPKEKVDSSKEIKDEKLTLKPKKEEVKAVEDKSPRRKLERSNKEKNEEKIVKTHCEAKPVAPELPQKPIEDVEVKPVKEDKPMKVEVEIKKEEPLTKEKLRSKLRDRKDDPTLSGDEVTVDSDERNSEDGIEKGSKLKIYDSDEYLVKGKRRPLKPEDKDDKESLLGLSDSDENESESEKLFSKELKHNEIEVGDRVKVKYGRGRMQKVYEAKVLKIEMDGQEKRFYVHYAGWNTRYDEWVRKNYIVAKISSDKLKADGLKGSTSSLNMKKIDRGRPPGILANTKPLDRKNSTGSLHSRATRSEKKSVPLSRGLEPKRRSRKKSTTATSVTDISQESDTDGMELEDDDMDSCTAHISSSFKDELFSDDEEKEKLEDVKRGDITQLEKCISVEENADEVKSVAEHPVSFEDEKNILKDKGLPVKSEISTEEGNVISDSNASGTKLPFTEPEDKKTDLPTENSVSSNLDTLQSEVMMPTKSPPLSKVEEIQDFTPVSSSSPSVSACSINASKFIPSLKPSAEESKATLSFAGLIKKTSIEKEGPLKKVLLSENLTGFSSDSEKTDSDCKSVPENQSRPLSMFEDASNSPENSETADVNKEEFTPQSLSNIFDSLLKQENGSSSKKESDSSGPKVGTRLEEVSQDVKLSTLTSSPSLNFSANSSNLERTNESLSSSGELETGKDRDVETKPKDKFDLLMESGSNFNLDPPKLSESKESIFSFTFSPHSVPEKNLELDKSRNKFSVPSDKLCRIQPEPSETVDVSKMIPGILERLKKDVIADLKVSDSPPPPKEELQFDFLRGSQSTNKCLSRSDSSNSLRICESDTNDSNVDSVLGNRLEIPLTLPDTSSCREGNKVISKHLPGGILLPAPPKDDSGPKERDSVSCQQLPIKTTETNEFVVSTITPNLDCGSLLSLVNCENSLSSEQSTSEVKLKLLDKSSFPKSEHIFESGPKLPVSSENVSFSGVIQQDSIGSGDVEVLQDLKEKLYLQESDYVKSSASCMESKNIAKCDADASEGTDSKPNLVELQTTDKETVHVKDENLTDSKEICDQNTSSIAAEDGSSNSCPIPGKEQDHSSNILPDGDSMFSQTSKKDIKRKKLGKKMVKKFGSSETSEKEDSKVKEGKTKSKKRLRLESDWDKGKSLDIKSKSKKLKKSKNKKRFSRHEDQLGDHMKKFDFRDDEHRNPVSDKLKKKEKKRSEKKFLKCGMKSEDMPDSKSDLSKKKKSKKNRDKFVSDKKDFFEKKTKKKRKLHLEDNQDTDSEKESLSKIIEKKRKRKKFKVKDCSSSDDAADKFFKEKKELTSTPSLLRQDSKSDDPDMSFLLCEEKVPASPTVGDLGDDLSTSSSAEDNSRLNSEMELLPSVYPCSSRESSSAIHKHSIDTVLDNTPPTTPSSTESLLSSSPSHERDSFSIHYPESTQSGEGEPDLFHCNSSRIVARGSEEYHAATTLAFAVCKTSVSENPIKDDSSAFMKRQKSDQSPSKRKKKRMQRYSESMKSPKHKSTFPRMLKVENYCEDSSGTSPATSSSPPYGNISSLSFTKSLPHRLSSASEGSSKYFYVPLHEKDPEKRIAVLQDKMAALRKRYMALRAEVIAIDHKRRKARKKVREAAGISTNPTVQSEDGQSCS